jgi:hypothetical protein
MVKNIKAELAGTEHNSQIAHNYHLCLMKLWLVGFAFTFMFLLVLGSGCAGTKGPAPTPTPTPTPATTQTTVATSVTTVPTTTNPLEPQPTVTPPNGWTTILTVSRNPSSYQPDLIVTYGGGTGQYILQQLEIIVTHPDGGVQTRTIARPENGSIPVQATAVISQTVNEPVRVQIIARYNGIDYSVFDEVEPQH